MADARRDRLMIASWLVGLFALSAQSDVRLLGLVALLALLVLHRGALRALLRTAVSVVPITLGLSLVSAVVLRLTSDTWPALEPFLALAIRTALMGFITFSVLNRVHLLRALDPYPTLARLLVLTLAQIHALRLVARESREGFTSRMPRRPGAFEVLRNAGGITATLFALAVRNARDITDAMRSRGY